ncbi:MAG: NUDIX hydrolase [Candidatus Heimdallarchaeaceae archaeon]
MRRRKKNRNDFYFEVVLVHPYRFINNKLEYLLIKRKTEGYNWQGVTGSLEKNETPVEGAIRELFEETGYTSASISNIRKLPDDFYNGKEEYGEIWEGHYDGDSYIKLNDEMIFVARVEEKKDPIIDPKEHTDWIWCEYERAYELIRWTLEKRLLRYINNMLINKEIKEK